MNELLPILISHEIRHVMFEKTGELVTTHDKLSKLVKDIYETLISHNALWKLALESEGSGFLKANIVCDVVQAKVKDSISKPVDLHKRDKLIIIASTATAAYNFLQGFKKSGYENHSPIQQAANAMLLKLTGTVR